MSAKISITIKPNKNNKSLIGKRFDRLTIIEDTKKRYYGYVVYRCICDCGNYTEASSHNLKNGNIVSCGCKLREVRDNWGQTVRQLRTEKHWNSRRDKRSKRKYRRIEGENIDGSNYIN